MEFINLIGEFTNESQIYGIISILSITTIKDLGESH